MSSPTALIYSHISAVTEQESPSPPLPQKKRKALQDICELISEKSASTTGDSEKGGGGVRSTGFSDIFCCNVDAGWVGGW